MPRRRGLVTMIRELVQEQVREAIQEQVRVMYVIEPRRVAGPG